MADKPKSAETKPSGSKPDTATLMAMFADDKDDAVASAKMLPPAAELSAVATEAWRSARSARQAPAAPPDDNRPPVAERKQGSKQEPASGRPSWMRIKADEQRFTSVRFNPDLTEILRHLAFLTRQSKTSLLNEALIDLAAKYRKSGVPLPELTADGKLKA